MPATDTQNKNEAGHPAAFGKAGRPAPGSPAGKRVLFGVLACLWFVLDRASKAVADANDVGDVFAGPFAGLFQFKLVHNTGAAWSMFSDSTFALGVFGLVVSAAFAVAAIFLAKRLTCFELAMVALVVAGGLGNAADRFAYGYVVDFIQTLFVSFPTFNVADIGVTCGISLFALSFILRMAREGE